MITFDTGTACARIHLAAKGYISGVKRSARLFPNIISSGDEDMNNYIFIYYTLHVATIKKSCGHLQHLSGALRSLIFRCSCDRII